MSEPPPQISILDARLAEIDQRLRTIQTGLVTEPPPPTATDTGPELPARVEVPEPASSGAGLRAVPLPAADQSLAEAVAQLRALAVAHEQLLSSTRGLLSDYERALTEARSAPAGAGAGEEARSLTVGAGPFAGTEAVRGFERTLAALPGVRGVELRGYEGGNRAIVDVHLAPPTS
ncbi:MAG: hypothetical protein ACR2GZ_06190 [Solirubrobacteraceae bacterium]